MPVPHMTFTDEEIFGFMNFVIIPWLALVFLPKWKGTKLIVQFAVLVYSVLYVLILWDYLSKPKSSGTTGDMKEMLDQFSTFKGVQALLANQDVTLLAWDHYVAFDLLAGYWIVTDAINSAIPHIFIVPVLFFTLMFGPTGFVMYSIVKFMNRLLSGKQKLF